MIGREDDLQKVAALLEVARFVTVVGGGGVGKTTVSVALGHDLLERFAGAVLFVDLSMLGDAELVTATVASMLGLTVRSDDTTQDLITYLQDKRILLILDTCEHLIEPLAAFASRLFRGAPRLHILATSREALQVDGEQVYRLEPLACPPDDALVTAEVARTFPATQLFVERAKLAVPTKPQVEAQVPAQLPFILNIETQLRGVLARVNWRQGRSELGGVVGGRQSRQ